LEKPQLKSVAHIDEYEYKIFISGKCGVGKSSTVAHLCSLQTAKQHTETAGLLSMLQSLGIYTLYSGIQTSVLRWPCKIVNIDRVVIFKLNFWDAGESAVRKFDHILPVGYFHSMLFA
jgi:GTPase SAR1 family protein